MQLQVPGVVAVTQPYPLEDFAPSPGFTVGGTVTGLLGTGSWSWSCPPRALPERRPLRLRPRQRPLHLHLFPRLVSGNPYQVRVKTQPTNPVQVCTITNASGTIEDANVTNVEVRCV